MQFLIIKKNYLYSFHSADEILLILGGVDLRQLHIAVQAPEVDSLGLWKFELNKWLLFLKKTYIYIVVVKRLKKNRMTILAQ